MTPPRLALNTVTNFTDNDKQWAAAATVVDGVRVEMYYPLSQLNERVTDLTRQAMLLIVVAIIGGTLVAWGAGHVVSLPLRHLAHAVRERTSESVRVPEDSGVDEVNQLGHAINALAERLEATLNSARSFSQNAAHELRTPLTSMRTDLDVLNTHSLPEDTRQKMFSNLVVQHERLLSTLNALQNLARGESQAKSEMVTADLAEIAEEAVEAARVLHQQAEIELITPDEVFARGLARRRAHGAR